MQICEFEYQQVIIDFQILILTRFYIELLFSESFEKDTPLAMKYLPSVWKGHDAAIKRLMLTKAKVALHWM